MQNESVKTRILRERYAGRGNRNQECATGANTRGGAASFRETPYPGEVTRHQHYVAGFKHMVDRARALRLSQGESISLPLRKSPSSDSGQSTPASPTRQTIQGRRRPPVLPSTKPWCRSPPYNSAAYEPGMGTSESPGTSPTLSANRKPNPAKTQPGIPADYPTKQVTSKEWSLKDVCILPSINRRHAERARTPTGTGE